MTTESQAPAGTDAPTTATRMVIGGESVEAADGQTFEIVNPGTGSNVVAVRSRDRSKVFAVKMTNFVYRPSLRELKPTITFGETPAGTPPPVKAWYPMNETLGREFIY